MLRNLISVGVDGAIVGDSCKLEMLQVTYAAYQEESPTPFMWEQLMDMDSV